MKTRVEKTIIAEGEIQNSSSWDESRDQVIESIENVVWPPGNDEFRIRPETEANGVNPITDQFESNLDSKTGWSSTGRRWFKSILEEENRLEEALDKLDDHYDDPEDFISSPWFDGMKIDDSGEIFVVEWETGNISSSHRSFNRIVLGLITGIISGGILILPSRNMYQYLTDRVGNYQEIEPYFLLWELLADKVDEGVLEVISVEQDETGDVPPVGKLTDGMSDRDNPEV